MNAATLSQQLIAAKREIDNALAEYEKRILSDADADRKAKVAKASAYLAASGTAGERTAHQDLATADVQHEARMAEGLKRSASQAVESKRQWLSALQSLSSLTRAEAQLAKWEPSETAGV